MLSLLLLFLQQSAPAVTLTTSPAPFQVLQRKTDGTADVECIGNWEKPARVEASVSGGGKEVGRGHADAKGGAFRVTVAGVPAGGPYRLTVRVDGSESKVEPFFVGDLWVLAGQSNMEGVGDLEAIEEPHAQVLCFESRDHWAVAEEPLHWLLESPDPVHWRNVTAEDRARIRGARASRKKGTGPGLSFAKEMVRRMSVPVGLVPCAHGGTSMEQWNPARAEEGGSSLYGSMLRRVRAVGGRVRGVLWYQGESDALAKPEVVAAYPQKLAELVAAMRKDFAAEELPFVCVQLSRLVDPRREGSAAAWSAVREAQRVLPAKIKGTAVVTAVDLSMDDPIHVSTPGNKRLGVRLAKAAVRLLGAQAPAAGPNLASAAVEGEQRTRVRLVFEGVNGGLRPATHIGGFTVMAGGKPLDLVFDASVDPAKPSEVVLRLREPLPEGAELWYGFGLNPYCNLVDAEDMAALAFGPVAPERS